METKLHKHNFINRRIHINDICLDSALFITDQMRYFAEVNPELPIHLLIYSYGGEVDAAGAIADEMEITKEKGVIVSTVAMGTAYSAAADILIRGTKGHRFARKRATIMMHPSSYGISTDYSAYQERLTSFIKKKNDSINKELSEILNKTSSKFSKEIEKGLWLTAEEAKNKGIIDDILVGGLPIYEKEHK